MPADVHALAQAQQAHEWCKQRLVQARQQRHAAVQKVQSDQVVKPPNWADQLVEATMSIK
jgi:hypothetical protein